LQKKHKQEIKNMKPSKLVVRASGLALVSDLEALEAGVKRFVGRRLDPSVGVAGGWVLKEEVSELPVRAEYTQALKEGDLEAANKETADHAGVVFKSPKQAKDK
jgi:hypothetical protein